MTSTANTENDALVVIPAITVPADIPAKITDAITRLEEIAHETKALTRFIGVEIAAPLMASFRWYETRDALIPEVVDSAEELIGWAQLSDQLQILASELIAAAGNQPDYDHPAWQQELGESWEEAKEAFDRALLENVG